MGYLLKEALKSFCGLNQWAYAVFWKIGCQNPKLLIWEDCYYETAVDSVFSKILTSQIGVQAGNRVSLLINEMMMRNQVHIVGEGMVGRAAFTGKHQWIHSENYLGDVHPPEVLNEAWHQYSAGMQTVAVIPILPHGVVQLGSLLAVVENVEFVSDVKSLIFQLGCISGALLSENFTGNATDGSEDIGTPTSYGPSVSADQLGKIKTTNAKSGNGENTASGERQVQIYSKSTASTFHTHNPTQASVTNQLENGFTGAIVIPPNFDTWMKQQALSHDSGFGFNHQSQSAVEQSGVSYSSLKLADDHVSSDIIFQDHVNSNCSASHSFVTSQPKMTGAGKNYVSAPMFGVRGSSNILPSYLNSIPASISNLNKFAEISPLSSQVFGISDSVTGSCRTQGRSAQVVNLTNNNQTQIKEAPHEHMPLSDLIPSFFQGFPEHSSSIQSPRFRNALEDSSVVQSHSEDGLFDIFDTDLFNLIRGNQNSSVNGPCTEKHKSPDSNIGVSKSTVFSVTGSDDLLDAVVSKAHLAANQSLSDNASCRTALTKISDRATMSNHISQEVFFHPKTLCREGILGTSPFISGCSKEDAGDCSQTSSIYGSQISSWVAEGRNVKRDTSVSTAYSKRPDEISKSSRKRLKPGENPRPRPKDRQMIQDRVKELREIVPNAAKCSIDALLERTIKHMLFLQSVTKHADKLKQTGEAKIISKEGGLLLKDNFEGGATWAFEVGSQSMVCPIIVEDLKPPRQMLVEMLCEERGLFLEIADIVRGLGLTILKGVMEARNDKIWARFAVEANRDVTRMEIFISLVGLLEKTMKNIAVSANNIDIENMMLHHPFQQAPCIPSTDRPGSVP